MFTGIIIDIGRVRQIVPGGDTRFEIVAAFEADALAIGASVACAGACLTVIETGVDARSGSWFTVAASAETLAKTTLGDWVVGARINLERALKIGDELGGHLVSGHVDGLGTLLASRFEGDSLRLLFSAPASIAHLIAPKGSIAVDGVSLTVNEVENATQERASAGGGIDAAVQFGVNIIAHTREHTTLGELKVGARVNLEADQMARYAARLMHRSADVR